jgi:hypothetical protein
MKLGIGVNLFKRREQKGTPIKDGLVAEYLFNEGRGQVLCDYSGNGNHGQLGSSRLPDTNDPLWTPQGLEFDGVDDYVTTYPHTCNLDSHEATCEIILHPYSFKQSSITEFLRHQLKDDNNKGGYYIEYRGDIGTSVIVVFILEGGIEKYSNFDISLIPLNVYTHISATYDGNYTKIYINGVLVKSQAVNNPDNLKLGNGRNLLIGDHNRGNRAFNGIIPMVRIYNRALSPEEVLQNYEWSKTELAKRGVIFE